MSSSIDPNSLPPWMNLAGGIVAAIVTAALAWGGIGARVSNLEAASVRIESKVDQLLLKQGGK